MFSRSLANRWYGMNRNDFHAWRETFDVDVHTPDIAQLLQDVPQLHALQTNLGMSPGALLFPQANHIMDTAGGWWVALGNIEHDGAGRRTCRNGCFRLFSLVPLYNTL